MTGNMHSLTDARQALRLSADGVVSVIGYLHTIEPTKDLLDTMEYLRQVEQILRKVKL
jgi:hypothetical protein